jgi:hypothetical protein
LLEYRLKMQTKEREAVLESIRIEEERKALERKIKEEAARRLKEEENAILEEAAKLKEKVRKANEKEVARLKGLINAKAAALAKGSTQTTNNNEEFRLPSKLYMIVESFGGALHRRSPVERLAICLLAASAPLIVAHKEALTARKLQ